MTDRNNIADAVRRNIEAIIDAKGLTESHVLAAARVNVSYMTDIRRGKSRDMQITKLQRIAGALQVPLVELFLPLADDEDDDKTS